MMMMTGFFEDIIVEISNDNEIVSSDLVHGHGDKKKAKKLK